MELIVSVSVPTLITSISLVARSPTHKLPKSTSVGLTTIVGSPVIVSVTGTSITSASGSFVSKTTTAFLVPALKLVASAVNEGLDCAPAETVPESGDMSTSLDLASPSLWQGLIYQQQPSFLQMLEYDQLNSSRHS